MVLKGKGDVGGPGDGGGRGEGRQGREGEVRWGERGGARQVRGRVEVTTASQEVREDEGCRTTGGTGCGSWGIRWEYWAGPWWRECAGRLSVSHEKRKKNL